MDQDQEYVDAFGRHLKSLRLKAGLTQEKLAEYCSVDFTQIGRYERGVRSPTLASMRKLANALKVHPKDLLDFDF